MSGAHEGVLLSAGQDGNRPAVIPAAMSISGLDVVVVAIVVTGQHASWKCGHRAELLSIIHLE